MIICSCHALSDRDVENAIARSSDSPPSAEQMHGCFGCQLKCGRCVSTIQRILDGQPACQSGKTWRENRLPQLCVRSEVSVDSATRESAGILEFCPS